MGQAKKRGTLEQRKAEAIKLHAEMLERDRIRLAERREQERLADIAREKDRPTRKRSSAMNVLMLSAAVLATSMPYRKGKS